MREALVIVPQLARPGGLPIMDFSAETAGAGTDVGYRTALTVNASSSMGGGTSTFYGCYKIKWTN